jgi:hypothetical protein
VIVSGLAASGSGHSWLPVQVMQIVMQHSRRARVLRMAVVLCVVLTLTGAHAAEFLTRDPLKAFVYSEYPLGDDYFIRGTEDTVIFRCLLT